MNSVQTGGTPQFVLYQIFYYLSIYAGLQVLFWMLHGPSRVMERDVAFKVRTNYELTLFKTVTSLPLSWHRDNHSGVTIAKINRAATALGGFWESSFEVIFMVTRFIGSLAVLVVFMPMAGVLSVAVTLLSIFIVWTIDKILIKQYDELS